MANEPAWCSVHQQNGIHLNNIGVVCLLCLTQTHVTVQSQPAPLRGNTEVLPLFIADLEARAVMREKKYGTRLMVENGRDHLEDAYLKALDLCMYLRAALEQQRKQHASR